MPLLGTSGKNGADILRQKGTLVTFFLNNAKTTTFH